MQQFIYIYLSFHHCQYALVLHHIHDHLFCLDILEKSEFRYTPGNTALQSFQPGKPGWRSAIRSRDQIRPRRDSRYRIKWDAILSIDDDGALIPRLILFGVEEERARKSVFGDDLIVGMQVTAGILGRENCNCFINGSWRRIEKETSDGEGVAGAVGLIDRFDVLSGCFLCFVQEKFCSFLINQNWDKDQIICLSFLDYISRDPYIYIEICLKLIVKAGRL